MPVYDDCPLCDGQHDHSAAQALREAELPPETELAEMAELFKAFGDSTRIRILYLLSRSALCVCDIAALLGLTQPAVSYQLKALKQARLVRGRRSGKTVLYALDDGHVATIIGMAKEHLEERLGGAESKDGTGKRRETDETEL